MKIWLPSIRAGSGSDVFVERLAAALQARGVEVAITWFGHRHELFPSGLARAEMPAGTDIIHANSWNAFAFARKGIPLVVTEHHCVLDPGYRPYKNLAQHLYHRWLVRSWEKRSFAAAQAITVPSRFTARVLASVMGVSPVHVIPNWIDVGHFVPAPAALARERFVLLFVGNPSRRKGADVLPELMRQLGEGFELRCTGGLRDEAFHAGSAHVRHLGRLSDAGLLAEYQQCDAFVFPSRYEGFGYAPLEAMACGRPVVAFACGAVAELLQDGVQGCLVPVDDVAAMAGAIRRLRDDPALQARMGAAARVHAGSYAEDVAIDAYLRLYQSLLSRSGQSS